MVIYLGCFIVVSFLSGIVSKINKRNRVFIVFLSALCILVPSILAGCRDTSIGTDVGLYITWDYNAALRTNNFFSFISQHISREPLYLFIIYYCTKLTGSINASLFVMQLITMTAIYVGAYKHKKSASMPLILGTFFLLYYNDSLNLVRQYMALAILFAGVDHVENSNYKKYLVYVVIAALFHKTAIISLALILMHWYLKKCKGRKMNFREIIFLFLMVMIITLFPQIYTILTKIGIVSSKYFYYFENKSVSNNMLETLMYLFEILFVWWNRKKLYTRIDNFEFYLVNLYALFGTLQLSNVIYYGSRISIYFGIINVYLLTQLGKIFRRKENQMFVNLGMLVVLVGYWYYIYVYGKSSATIPYISMFD